MKEGALGKEEEEENHEGTGVTKKAREGDDKRCGEGVFTMSELVCEVGEQVRKTATSPFICDLLSSSFFVLSPSNPPPSCYAFCMLTAGE